MATTTTAWRRQVDSAGDLESVVRTIEASAASAIGRYERSVAALADYARTVELELSVCLRSVDPNGSHAHTPTRHADDTVSRRLLPLDERWRRVLSRQPRPTARSSTPLPEVMGTGREALRAFIREHLFVSLFRAGAESLASENAGRFAATQRADRNIGDLLTDLGACMPIPSSADYDYVVLELAPTERWRAQQAP